MSQFSANFQTVTHMPDLGVTFSLCNLCRESIRSLESLSRQSDSLQLTQTIGAVIASRQGIVDQLLAEQLGNLHCDCDMLEIAAMRYRKIRLTDNQSSESLLSRFAEADRLALQDLRHAFKTVRDLGLACHLSSLLATFQISSDQLRDRR